MSYHDIITYLLYGNNTWKNRWNCTGHDLFLCILMIFCCLLSVYECAKYIIKSNKMIKNMDNMLLIGHTELLKCFFGQIIATNILTFIVLWFWTPYYPICVLILYNAYCTHKLNLNRSRMLSSMENKLVKCNEVKSTSDGTLKEQLKYHIDKLEESCKWTQ